MPILFIFILSILISSNTVLAKCNVQNSNGERTDAKDDALYLLLQNTPDCPKTVQDLKAALKSKTLSSTPYMVANRGIHNPSFGSFSLFEEVIGSSKILKEPIKSGEFFFGHFTTAENGLVAVDQELSKGKLLVELIVWDVTKKLFNFYELIGTGQGSQWFYRGDSQDVLSDNASLYLKTSESKGSTILRCSACHVSGGPIMKEIAAPHNDWWTGSRPLVFAPNSVTPELAKWIGQLGDAADFSRSVTNGIEKLQSSVQFQNAKQQFSLQTQLRPLFCETEINLESDLSPLNNSPGTIQIPSASVVNPLLATESLQIATPAYLNLLKQVMMEFPENSQIDADHGWLVPVKGVSDLKAIQSLIDHGVVTDEFVADVLAIDFKNPLFSSKRCNLLKLIPNEGLSEFVARLKSSEESGANELLENLTNSTFSREFHTQKALAFLKETQAKLKSIDGQKVIFKKLIENRQAVLNSEISKNPRGQILEPGFRVIFPINKKNIIELASCQSAF